jgi:D-alanine-D-alanine ligase-like ATP-grasp enzyme
LADDARERIVNGPRALAWRLASRAPSLFARLDLLRSTGARGTWRLRRDLRRWERLEPSPRDLTYLRVWEDAAREAGAELEALSPRLLEIRRNGVRTRVEHQVVALDDPATLATALDKARVHRLLTSRSLKVPDYVEIGRREIEPALEFLSEHSPCVVKPAEGTAGGLGVTGSVTSASQLRRALLAAGRYDDRVLIEAQIPGHLYRLLFLDGRLIDVVRRHPPRVTGDGRSSVRELVAQENDRRVAADDASAMWPLRIDLDCVLALERLGVDLDDVVPEGVTMTIKTATSENCTQDNETVTTPLAPELVSEAAAAAQALALRLAGLDVITPDISSSLAAAGGAIVEVNGTPGLSHHYHVADAQRATRVAVPILETLLREPQTG